MSTKNDPRHTKPTFNINDRAIVFDADEWNFEDVGDNSQFNKTATVIKIYKNRNERNEWLADVIFDDNPNKISRRHIQSAMKSIKQD